MTADHETLYEGKYGYLEMACNKCGRTVIVDAAAKRCVCGEILTTKEE